MDVKIEDVKRRRYIAFSRDTHVKIGPLYNNISFLSLLGYHKRNNLPSILTSVDQFTHFYEGVNLDKTDINAVWYISFHPPNLEGSLKSFIKELKGSSNLARVTSTAIDNLCSPQEEPQEDADEMDLEIPEEWESLPLPQTVASHLIQLHRNGEHSLQITDGAHTHHWFRFPRKQETSVERLDRSPIS